MPDNVVVWTGSEFTEWDPYKVKERGIPDWAREATQEEAALYRQYASALRSANAEIARLREALEPFAALADRYDPPEGDDTHAAWDQTALPTLGDFRRARAALKGKPG
jgi:hypothetical protein